MTAHYGPRLSARLAAKGNEQFKSIDEDWINRQIELTRKLRLPALLSDVGRRFGDATATTPQSLVELMSSDKKAEFGKLSFILPINLGECVYLKGIDPEDVLAVLN